jgi:hypothetical protein
MTDLPVVSGSLCPDLSDDTRHFLTPVSAQKCLSGMCLASASEAQALIAAAHRLDNLIHHRRMMLTARTAASGTAI